MKFKVVLREFRRNDERTDRNLNFYVALCYKQVL